MTQPSSISPVKDGVKSSNELSRDLKEIHDVDGEPGVGGGEDPDIPGRTVHLVLQLLLSEESLHRLPASLHPRDGVALPLPEFSTPGPGQVRGVADASSLMLSARLGRLFLALRWCFMA